MEVRIAAIHAAIPSIEQELLKQLIMINSLEYQPEVKGRATNDPEPIIK